MMKYVTVILTTAFLATAACAAEPAPRTVDMTALILDFDGRKIRDVAEREATDTDCLKCPDLTLGLAIGHALTWATQGDGTISAEQKFSRGLLAERIRNDKAAVLDASDTAAIEKLVARIYGPIIVTRVIQALDPNAKPERLQ